MTTDQQQKLFDYFKQEHDVFLLYTDFIEIENILKDQGKDIKDSYVPYQLCPMCHGQKTVSKPPHLAGDVNQWTSSGVQFSCGICTGAGIIPMAEKVL